MRMRGCLLAMFAIVTVSRADGDADPVPRLVARLASPDFRERESATRELDRLGDAALAVLRDAAQPGDTEARRRAAGLVERIARRQATGRVLDPSYVSLNYENTPLLDAV